VHPGTVPLLICNRMQYGGPHNGLRCPHLQAYGSAYNGGAGYPQDHPGRRKSMRRLVHRIVGLTHRMNPVW